MVQMLSIATKDLPHQISVEETKVLIGELSAPAAAQHYRRLVDRTHIENRYALAPLSQLRDLTTIDARNAAYAEHAPTFAARAGEGALQCVGIDPSAVDVLIVASSTGHIIPTLDTHLISRLGLRSDIRSVPILDLGCAGAVRAIALAAEFLSAKASASHALIVSLELCSLWLPAGEPSAEDVFTSMIFGDGIAAAVIGNRVDAQAPEVFASRSVLWPDSLSARGARLTTSGFRHFSSPALQRVLRANLRKTVGEFLASNGLTEGNLQFYAINPSDHGVLATIGSLLDLPEQALQSAWQTWRQRGNTLSAGPLYVLDELQTSGTPGDGDLGLVLVLGPGIVCEMLLLRWHGRIQTAA